MLFAAICTDKANSFDLRTRLRQDHFAFLAANEGRVRLAGPFLDDDGRMNGSLLIVEAENRDDANALLSRDPYAQGGLFSSVDLRPWRWTVGAPK